MYHKRSRSREIARRTFVYSLMVFFVCSLATLLTLYMLGYRFNLQTQQVTQTGLVQYDSFPRGALVSVDGNEITKTQGKSTVPLGQRQFSMKLKGYEQWQKTLDIKPDTVTHLSYARLVPTEKRTTWLHEFQGLETTLFSPSGEFVFGVINTPKAPAAMWGDLRSIRQPVIKNELLPTNVVAGYGEGVEATHQFTAQAWSQDNRFVLVKHRYTLPGQPQHTQWLRLDRDKPAELMDISTMIGPMAQDVQFASHNGQEVYVLGTAGDLTWLRLHNAETKALPFSRVKSFHIYNHELIAYSAESGEKLLLGVWHKGWQAPQVLRTIDKQAARGPIHIRASHYFHKDTVIVGVGGEVTMYRGVLPNPHSQVTAFLKTAKRFTLGRDIHDILISDNGRFVVARGQTGFVSYDLERATLSQEIGVPLRARLKWLDGFHFWSVDDDQALWIREFDGINAQLLAPKAVAGLDVSLSRDGKYLYSFIPSSSGVMLQRLAMTTED